MEKLIAIDRELLLIINGWHSEWADVLMWYISRSTTWIPLYLVLIFLLIYRYRSLRWWQIALTLLTFAVAVGAADYISSGIIKHLVCRLRPTHAPMIENLLHIVRGYRGGLYGFVSSHAANTMAVAVLFNLLYKSKSWLSALLYLWVGLNCYSRMYLGVHYPADILGGLLVGSLCSLATYYAWSKWVFARAADADRAPARS